MKNRMLLGLVIFVPAVCFASAKSQNEVVIESASQFQLWCKTSSLRHFRQKKLTPYNWSASTIRKLNDYLTTGSWKINNTDLTIFCQIRKGKKAKYTKMQILHKN